MLWYAISELWTLGEPNGRLGHFYVTVTQSRWALSGCLTPKTDDSLSFRSMTTRMIILRVNGTGAFVLLARMAFIPLGARQ